MLANGVQEFLTDTGAYKMKKIKTCEVFSGKHFDYEYSKPVKVPKRRVDHELDEIGSLIKDLKENKMNPIFDKHAPLSDKKKTEIFEYVERETQRRRPPKMRSDMNDLIKSRKSIFSEEYLRKHEKSGLSKIIRENMPRRYRNKAARSQAEFKLPTLSMVDSIDKIDIQEEFRHNQSMDIQGADFDHGDNLGFETARSNNLRLISSRSTLKSPDQTSPRYLLSNLSKEDSIFSKAVEPNKKL